MAAIAHPGSASLRLEPDFANVGSAYNSPLANYGSASLTSTVLNYKYENGRRYHAYTTTNLTLSPTTSTSTSPHNRLDLLHHIFKILTGGELWRAPLRGPNAALPRRVLDLGTGSGIWAMEAAEDLPGASVLGVDLSAAAAVAPKFVPGNCRLEVADFEKSWTFVPEEEEKFDFIHGRALGGSVADFRGLLKRVYEGLRPGGWVEFQEYEGGCESDDDTLRLVPALEAWQREVREARGKSRAWVGELKGLLGEAGFVDVQEDRYKGPVGTWAKGKMQKELGLSLLAQNLDAVEPLTLATYHRKLGFSLQETQQIVDTVKRDLLNKDAHLYVPFTFVYGRKAA